MSMESQILDIKRGNYEQLNEIVHLFLDRSINIMDNRYKWNT